MTERHDVPVTETWALLVETTANGVEVYRGGMFLASAQQAADRILASRPDVRQVTVYPVEGGHAEGKASWVRGQDGGWQNVREALER